MTEAKRMAYSAVFKSRSKSIIVNSPKDSKCPPHSLEGCKVNEIEQRPSLATEIGPVVPKSSNSTQLHETGAGESLRFLSIFFFFYTGQLI